MRKIKLAVIFGGMSTEHDVSIVSGASVLNNLDKEKYEIFPIYIDEQVCREYRNTFYITCRR